MARMPNPDAQYARDIDAAFMVRGRAILALLKPYSREPDMKKARDDFNAAAAHIDPDFQAAVVAAQDALRRRATPVATCLACGQAMSVIEPGQEYHPMCEPIATTPAEPDGAAAVVMEDEEW